MILAHPDFNKQIHIEHSKISEWIIESPEFFLKYLKELLSQIKGQAGNFVLSDKDKEIDIAKSVDIIMNPLQIDINDKKILSKIYAELLVIANDETMYLKTKELVGTLQQYFFELEQNYNTTLIIEDEFEIKELFKTIGVRVEEDSLNDFERLIQYIELQVNLLKKKLVILVNIKSFLTEEQLEQLFEYVKYNEIDLLLVESIQRDFTNQTNKFIIDIDKCEI